MGISRREFLVASGVGGAGLALSSLGLDLGPVKAFADVLKIDQMRSAKHTSTICPHCSVGCSLIVSTDTKSGKIINIEGDSDSPINEGSLCAKGASLFQTTASNPNRLTKVLYRAPFGDKWEEKSWDWAISEIAKRAKATRDANFIEKNGKGQVVNRVEAIAHLGSSNVDNEEIWAMNAMVRALGIVYLDHQARICHSPSVAALGESFGRGSMTNHIVDMRNSDCFLIMGSNAAECHPITMRWVTKAKENGATVIHVDPRFTRTSAIADFHASLRSGTDIAFLGGMISYIIEKKKYFKEYVENYTNASYVVGDKYDFNDGLFSGYNKDTKKYDASTWAFKRDKNGAPEKDPTLQNPRCVFQLLKKHYSRYTPAKVSEITGTPIEDLLKVYEMYSSTGVRDKAGTVFYALGWTQHTVGTENIRASAIVQLLLGNIGIAGGGIAALRGQPNVQGSTDGCLLFHLIPGYLKVPRGSQQTLETYMKAYTPTTGEPQSVNWWQNYPKYTVSLLKSFFGEKASKENDYGYSWLPKADDGKTYSWLDLFDEMYAGKTKGLFIWSQNPTGSSPNTKKTVKALSNLDWLVHANIFNNETASFWFGPGIDPKKVKTEVFLLPAACSVEREGSITNTGRMAQWRFKATDPPGDAIPDGEMVNLIVAKIKELYAKEGGKFPEPILNLKWDYTDSKGAFDPHKMAKEINGYFLKDITLKDASGKDVQFKKGDLVPSFAFLQADGSTSSGNWLYAASYTNAGNMMARRGKDDPTGLGLFPNWAWVWPVNRRVLYNRASCDPSGQPWNPKKALLKWENGKWVGDVPDGPWPPMSDKEKGKLPFIMKPDGHASLFGPGMVDGPFPEHYEPLESPLSKNPLSSQQNNPAIKIFKSDMDKVASADPKFPIVCSTYTVTEHWCSGAFTRWQPWLLEAQPELFVEISEQLAKELGIKNGERAKVSSIRGEVECVAMVTPRFRPFKVAGRTVHQVGMPFCFGWLMPKSGQDPTTNHLTLCVGDANTMCPEYKAFMVNVKKA